MRSGTIQKWALLTLFNSALLQGAIYVIRPMITYRGLELGLDGTGIGVLGALYAILPVALAVSFGRLVGKVGEKKFLIWGGASVLVTGLLLSNANSFLVLGILTAIAGTGHLAVMVGGQTMMANRSEPGTYDKYFGYYTFSASLGQMVGSLLGGIAGGSNGSLPKSTATAFLVSAVLAFIGVLPILFTKSLKVSIADKVAASDYKVKARDVIKNPGLKSALFTSAAVSSTVDVLVIFLPLFGQENNLSPIVIGTILAIRSGASMFSRLFLGELSRRFGSKRIMILSGFVATITIGSLILTTNVLIIEAIILVAGFALGIGQPLTMAWVSLASAPEERGMAISLRLTGNRVGQFILPVGAGLVAGSMGVSSVFLGLAGLLAASTLVSNRYE